MDEMNQAPAVGRARGRRRVTAEGAQAIVSSLMGRSRTLPLETNLAMTAVPDPELESIPSVSTLAEELSTTSVADMSTCSMTVQSSGGSGVRTLDTMSIKSTSSSDGGKGVRVTKREGFVKESAGGERSSVMTNYLYMNKTSGFQLLQYRVDFSPEEDSTLIKKLLVRSHEATIGSYVFDGHMLYTTKPIPQELRKLESVGGDGKVTFEIMIKSVGYLLPTSPMYLQFYNMVMRKAITLIGYEEIGRHYYDRNQAIRFEAEKLELWPGIVTAIRNHDAGILLCLEVTHKVLRMSSMYDWIERIKKSSATTQEYEFRVKKELVGVIVMTHYNRKTYRVDDIDFTLKPGMTFRLQDGTLSTYADYYQSRYNIKNLDLDQPMLVSFPRQKDTNKGVTGNINLVPALCNPTGLTDEMRKNFTLMRKLSDHLHMGPKDRKRMLDDFVNKIRQTPSVQAEFEKWGIDFIPKFLMADARKLPIEEVYLGGSPRSQPVTSYTEADWTRQLNNRGMLEPVEFTDWILFIERKIKTEAAILTEELQRSGRKLGMRVAPPLKVIEYETNQLNSTVKRELEKMNGLNLNFAFVMLPNNNVKVYSDVKKTCIMDYEVGSQCMLSKHLSLKDSKARQKLGSICNKLVIQINAKLGGVPWGVKIPVKRMMILGFDVYHCAERKGQSAGALVSTRDQSLNQYFSSVSFHADKSELACNLTAGMRKALKAYGLNNQDALPDRIVLYRDGVGEGQINYVLDYEIPRLKQGIKEFYDDLGVPHAKLSVIIVTKKINTRVLLANAGAKGISYSNVPSGTVVDNTITLPERYDFFLAAQHVNQGTVSPTNYNVVHDEIAWDAERMQRLSFKLCHLYYNWCGTVAVPAPCQYAHKLAYLTGVAISQEAPLALANNLWYL